MRPCARCGDVAAAALMATGTAFLVNPCAASDSFSGHQACQIDRLKAAGNANKRRRLSNGRLAEVSLVAKIVEDHQFGATYNELPPED